MTSRRDFVMAGAASVAALCLGCGPGRPEPGWEAAVESAGDVRMRLLRYAALAPSSHNTQPWRVQLMDSGIRLYVDRRRLLHATDPPARQTHISQGTFLEMLDIAARKLGYSADIRYFPDGEYANNIVEDKPVAEVTFLPERPSTPDPLFEEISKRVTNKRLYNLEPSLTTAEMDRLRASFATEGLGWRMAVDESQRKNIAGICKQAMSIEVSSVERNRETATWFRFSERELRDKRDGFGLAQTGTEGVKRWIAETFVLTRERAADPGGSFAQGAVTQTQNQTNTASGFAALISNGNTRLDQVLTGRAYARVHLTASQLGLAIQPLSQALEEYEEMAPLQATLKQVLSVADGETIQMLFRLGHAKPTPHSPRREAATLLR